MAASAMALGGGTRQLVGLKERFALGSSDMFGWFFFFFKLFQMLRYFLVVCAAFCARTILQFGGKTYD